MNCKCGAELKQGAKFCVKCGANLQENNEPNMQITNETESSIEDLNTNVEKDALLYDVEEGNNFETNDLVQNMNVESINSSEENNSTGTKRNSKNRNKTKNNKVLLIVLAVLIIFTAVVSIVYFTQFRNSIRIDDVDATLYPIVIIKLEDSSGVAYREDNFVIYQDGVAIEDIEEDSRGEYILLLDSSKSSGENTVISVSKVIYGSTEIKTDEEKVKIKNTLFEDNFTNTEFINEDFPVVTILTKLNTNILDTEFVDSLKFVLLNEPLSEEAKSGTNFDDDFASAKKIIPIKSYEIYDDEQVALTVDLGDIDRTEKFYYTFAFDIEGLGIEYNDYEMQFEPLNNIIHYENLFYDNMPSVELYLEVRDENYNGLQKTLDLNKFKLQDGNGNDIPFETSIVESGEILLDISIDDVESGISYFVLSYQDNEYGFVTSVDLGSDFEDKYQYFKESKYDSTHSYEVVYADKTWYEAMDAAEKKGGYLARIGSEEELSAITKAITDSGNSALTYWVGATRNIDGGYYYGDYCWVNEYMDAVSEPIYSSDMWLPGEPSYGTIEEIRGTNTFVEEDSVSLFYRSSEKKWYLNDVPNDLLAYYDSFKGKIAYVIEYDN